MAEEQSQQEQESDQQEQKPHQLDKGLQKLQQRQARYEQDVNKRLDDIASMLKSSDKQRDLTTAEQKVQDFLEGRDDDDMPTVKDLRQLYNSIGKSGGVDESKLKSMIQEALNPVIEQTEAAKQERYWQKFKGDHPDLTDEDIDSLLQEAGSLADEDGYTGKGEARNASVKTHFKHLVKAKEAEIKSSKQTGEKKPSTKSPKSPAGAQVKKESTSATGGSDDQPKSKMDLISALPDKWNPTAK